MNVFLGRESFPDPYIDVSRFRGTFLGRANFNGCIAFCNWERPEVAQLLPSELELAANRSAAPDLHPVVFIFGEQRNVATIFAGISFGMGVSYHEFCMAIPFVKHRRGRYLHTFVPRMYSSFSSATWAGNAHFGFSKAMASMRRDQYLFVITNPDDRLLLHAATEPAGEWVDGSSCQLPNSAEMRSVFALPVVGRKQDGTYVESYFDWDFGSARIRPIRAALSIDAPLVDGLAPRWCAAVPSGSFEVERMVWRLSWPAPCSF